jgi:hypothetical protein
MPNTTQSTNPKKGSAPVHCGKFESSRYSYTDLEVENERNKAQMIAYPRYTHPNGGDGGFVFQTDWINFTQYGLPKKGTKPGDYYMEDKDRCFLKVPLDKSQESCVQLENMLMEIDKYNVKNVETIFKNFAASKGVTPSKAAKLFTYQPAVRTPQDDDELAEVDGKSSNNAGTNKPKTERFKYCKMQFNSSYPDKTITTQVYLREGEGENVKITEVSPKTPTELEDLGLGWGASVRMIVMINKLWAAKSTNQQTKTRSYGISMKIMQLEIIPRVKQGSIRDQFTKYAFIDGEESDDAATLNTKSSKPSTTTPVKTAAKEDDQESENDENEGEDEGEDKVEEEDEEEEVEEAGGEEEEDEESEEAPKSKSKKATTTATNNKKGKSRTSASRR